jgi:Na+/melibiose symporter-like transporter
MKLLLEILLSIILHPIAMILMWINLAARADMSGGKKVIWFIVSIVWGLGPILYCLVADGNLW